MVKAPEATSYCNSTKLLIFLPLRFTFTRFTMRHPACEIVLIYEISNVSYCNLAYLAWNYHLIDRSRSQSFQ